MHTEMNTNVTDATNANDTIDALAKETCELNARFFRFAQLLQEAEDTIEQQDVSESTAPSHAKAVFCALQFRRLLKNTKANVDCVQELGWHKFSFFTSLNSEILTKQAFRKAILGVLKSDGSGKETAALFKTVLRELVSLAENIRHKRVEKTEAYYSTIALIKLNRLLELKDFETAQGGSYEEFKTHEDPKMDVRLENTRALRTATTAGHELKELTNMERFLRSLHDSLLAMRKAMQGVGSKTLRYAQLWAEVFDGDQCSFGVESYILKCEKELKDYALYSEKLLGVANKLGDLVALVQDSRGRIFSGTLGSDAVGGILQQVTAAGHLVLCAVLQVTGQRMHDLVGEELIQRYRCLGVGKESRISGPRRGLSKRFDKGKRFVLHVTAGFTANRKDTRDYTRKREPSPPENSRHDDIVDEYVVAIQFTLQLMNHMAAHEPRGSNRNQ